MKITQYTEQLEIPEGVTVALNEGIVIVKGKNGELHRELSSKKINISIGKSEVNFSIPVMAKAEKMLLGTFKSHIKNMIEGVQKNYKYSLKICSGHFPMNAAVTNNQVVVKNFIGEKKPRVLSIIKGVTVKVDGEVITVESNDIELAGMTAAAIERLVSRTGFDKRVFQQGIYITEKPR
ncbi:50S ribosomal protein L6 [Candidatus Woesearchaeota archaeon]|nr:50S ribosomal protein L6P [uncultured archaeon]MBS3136806.1 50S ribosomal protein L6 [Candidatus Woesearchaeota archaeon]